MQAQFKCFILLFLSQTWLFITFMECKRVFFLNPAAQIFLNVTNSPPLGGPKIDRTKKRFKIFSATSLSQSLGPWDTHTKKSAQSDLIQGDPVSLAFEPKIQRIFKIYKGKKITTRFSIFVFINICLAKIGSTGLIAEVQTLV